MNRKPPSANAIANRRGMLRKPNHAAATMTRRASTCPQAAPMSTARFDRRSIQMPANTPTTIAGAPPNEARMPICRGVASRRSAATSGTPSSCIWKPAYVNVWLAQSLRKVSCRQSPDACHRSLDGKKRNEHNLGGRARRCASARQPEGQCVPATRDRQGGPHYSGEGANLTAQWWVHLIWSGASHSW